jgi:hypothetical protein
MTGRAARGDVEIRRQWKHLSTMNGATGAIHLAGASKIGRQVRHLHPIVDFHACRTLTRSAGLEANRRQKRDGNFSCGKTRFFRGDDVEVPLWKKFLRF